MQLDISNSVHTRENNNHSEAILFEQYNRLKGNNKIIYEALKRGERLSGKDIMLRYGMSEYRRRIADLKEYGLPIKETIIEGGCKVWYLELPKVETNVEVKQVELF